MSVRIPKNVTEIGEGAFFWCNKLADVTFDNKTACKYIGENAFAGTPFKARRK